MIFELTNAYFDFVKYIQQHYLFPTNKSSILELEELTMFQCTTHKSHSLSSLTSLITKSPNSDVDFINRESKST